MKNTTILTDVFMLLFGGAVLSSAWQYTVVASLGWRPLNYGQALVLLMAIECIGYAFFGRMKSTP